MKLYTLAFVVVLGAALNMKSYDSTRNASNVTMNARDIAIMEMAGEDPIDIAWCEISGLRNDIMLLEHKVIMLEQQILLLKEKNDSKQKPAIRLGKVR